MWNNSNRGRQVKAKGRIANLIIGKSIYIFAFTSCKNERFKKVNNPELEYTYMPHPLQIREFTTYDTVSSTSLATYFA